MGADVRHTKRTLASQKPRGKSRVPQPRKLSVYPEELPEAWQQALTAMKMGLPHPEMKCPAEVAELADDLNAERRVSRELRGEVVELSDNLVNERQIARRLQGEVADLTDRLVVEQGVARRLTAEATDLSDELLVARRQLDNAMPDLVSYRGRRVPVSEAVEETANLISSRARTSAAREVGSMAGEALPYLGAAVIVGVTALELKDLCDTIRDMNALKRAFNPALNPDDGATTVCSMEVPSSDELWSSAKGAPRAAWEGAKGVVQSLPSIDDVKVPDLDWSGYWNSVGDGFSAAYQASASGAARAYDGVTRLGAGAWTYFGGGGSEPTAVIPEPVYNPDPRGF